MHGTIEVSKHDKSLYSILLREYNNGYAAKYTGNHQDSMDSSKSTYDIYHFYATNDNGVDEVLNRNNVVFAGTCWEIIRTTDTGGVRLMYNGEAEESIVDGETVYNCGNTRNTYHMGTVMSGTYLYGNRLYASSYTVSKSGNDTVFTLVDPVSYNMSNETAPTQVAEIVENYPYTCASDSASCVNDRFYKVDRLDSGTYVYAYKSTAKNSIGESKYNNDHNSIAYVGYKYGTPYTNQNLSIKSNQGVLSTGWVDLMSTTSVNANHYYASSYDWNTQTANKYTLLNPYLASSVSDNSDLVDQYTFFRDSQGYTDRVIRRVIGVDNNTVYYRDIWDGRDITDYEPIVFGDSLIDNGNGTYTLDQTENRTYKYWFNHHSDFIGKYVCGDATLTCNNPKYIVETTSKGYRYIDSPAAKITIAKARNGLTLSNYITIDRVQWYYGYNTTYADYVYTCGNTDTTCTSANLKYITAKENYKFSYILNRNYAESVTYTNNKYVLQNTVPLESITNAQTMSTHHYTCIDAGATECNAIAYIYYYTNGENAVYIRIDNPDILSVEDAIEDMITTNITDSVIKTNVDNWYELNLKNTIYESKIDDTIYCNDRSFSTTVDYRFQDSAWNDNGGALNKDLLYFKEFNTTTDLSCTNETDRFSVSNNKAKLDYKIAIMSEPELNITHISNGHTAQLYSEISSYTMTPAFFSGASASTRVYSAMRNSVTYYGYWAPLSYASNVRPAISLVKEAKYSSGSGSPTDPYVVDMSN